MPFHHFVAVQYRASLSLFNFVPCCWSVSVAGVFVSSRSVFVAAYTQNLKKNSRELSKYRGFVYLRTRKWRDAGVVERGRLEIC